MANRTRPWLALLVSALVHAGVAFILAGHGGRDGSRDGRVAQAGPVLVVSLVSDAGTAARRAAPQPAIAAAVEDATPATRTPPAAAQAAKPAAPAVERRYFGAGAMTQEPAVADGLIDNRLLIVPGITPATVALEVWISDSGTVDRVEVESPLPEAERLLLVAELSKVRFHPGRIGRIAIHGRLSMKIMVDYALRS